ncbi:hypothetical protein GGI10_003501, partial [Coemansia sp. RSA 2530]
MPNYQVVRCANDDCAKFQSQQEKKAGKWTCVVCRLKQSLKRVYFQSTTPKDCRSAVMQFNMTSGQAEAAKQKQASLVAQTFPSFDDDPSANAFAGQGDGARLSDDEETGAKPESRWAAYSGNMDEPSAKLDDDSHDLDQHNRIVAWRDEQSGAVKEAKAHSRTRNPPAPRGQPRVSKATLANTRQQQPSPPVRHMPYRRPDPQANAQAKDKPTLSQALASITQRSRPANTSAVT